MPGTFVTWAPVIRSLSGIGHDVTMSADLVIFDCDGVLVDSERLSVRVEVRLLTELGWPVEESEVVERFVGRSDAHMLAEIERVLARPVPGWTERYETELHAAFREELRPVDGIVEVLDELERIGVATCVASSGTHEKMTLTLGTTGLRERFLGRIFSATEVEHGKPAPDVFLHAAERMGVDPLDCVVVEDSPSGVEAALAAGMRCVAYASGLIPVDRLEAPGVVLIDDMREVPAHL